MPRAASKKPKTKKKAALPEWKRMNLRSQLEKQLEGVLETAVPVEKSEPVVVEARVEEKREIAPPMLSETRSLDARLVASLTASPKSKTKKLHVRIGDHAASPYLV